MAERSTLTKTVTSVRHIAGPYGRPRENPPCLDDLREFVAKCEGLPGELKVFTSKSQLDEGGRYTVTFSVSYDHPGEALHG